MVFQQRPLETGEDATYDAGGFDGDSGINVIPDQADPGGSPTLRFRTAQLQHQLSNALKQINAFAVASQTKLGLAGLAVDVKGGIYRIASTEHTLADTDGFACTDNATNWLFCDATGTVEKSTTAWPTPAHFKIAKVVTSAGAITSIVPSQQLNHNPGVTDVWAATPADQDVDLAGFDLEDIGQLDFGAATTLTISSAVVTPTQVHHLLATEGAASTDTLSTITADAAKVGQVVIFRGEDASDVITIDTAGNITTGARGSVLITGSTNPAIFQQVTATTWACISRMDSELGTMVTDITFDGPNGIGLDILGKLNFGSVTGTIATGAVANTNRNALIGIATESSASTDELDTVSGANASDILIISPKTSDIVVVKHAVGADKFSLMNSSDYSMLTTGHYLLCIHDSTQWVEFARSHHDGSELAGGAKAFAFPIEFFEAGGQTVSVKKKQVIVPFDMVIESATGYADTAPTDATMIVDVLVDDLSIYASQAEMINITTGTKQDTSAVKDTIVAAGSRIQIEVEQVGSTIAGSDLTVTLKAYAAAQTPR